MIEKKILYTLLKLSTVSFFQDNLLEKRTFTSDEKTVIQLGSEVIQWSPKFRLYLITKEENSASNLELASKVALAAISLPSVPFILIHSNFVVDHNQLPLEPGRIRG